MKWILACVVVGMVAGAASGQVATDEALKNLQNRQATKQAERNKVVTVKQGELDDMRAELIALRAEVARLRARVAVATTRGPDTRQIQPEPPKEEKGDPIAVALKEGRITVGMNKEQVLKVFSVRRRDYGGGAPIQYRVTTREITTSKGAVSIEQWESSWYYPGLFSTIEFRNGIVDSVKVD